MINFITRSIFNQRSQNSRRSSSTPCNSTTLSNKCSTKMTTKKIFLCSKKFLYAVTIILISCCYDLLHGVNGFLTPQTTTTTTTTSSFPRRTTAIARISANDNNDNDNENLKKEIEEMKAEALRRLETLQNDVQQQRPDILVDTTTNGIVVNNKDYVSAAASSSSATTVTDGTFDKDKEEADIFSSLGTTTDDGDSDDDRSISNFNNGNTNTRNMALLRDIKRQREELDLLEGSCWKVVLNVGRNPGTWMPEEWGQSGKRLKLTFEVEFCHDSLYLDQPKEEFFGFPMSIGRLLKVRNNGLAVLGPTSTHMNSKQVRLRSGGWKVCPEEGPAGTTILKWYVEVLSAGDGDIQWGQDNEISKVGHRGSDVYLPAGRIYGTCGYFPSTSRGSTSTPKQILNQQRDQVYSQYDDLQVEMEQDTRLISWDKVRNIQKKKALESKIDNLTQELNKAMIQEPDTSILRSSKDGKVSLTKEGGLCCKVYKSGGYLEYHILGTFGLVAIENDDAKE